MKLNEVFRGMICEIHGDETVEIKDLKYDSRGVKLSLIHI